MRALLRTLNGFPWIYYLGFVVFLSYFTYFHNYQNPPDLFWDENYHIASAQKYQNNVYFMEPHPPLAKLLIAFGETIWNANEIDDSFLDTDYARNLPDDFSFVGYRFFPVLFAWLGAPVLFGIFLLLTKNSLWSTLLSFFYIFDNALIVHFRSAMLDSTLNFFVLCSILLFLLLLNYRGHPSRWRWLSLLFGIAIAAVATTKVNGLIVVLVVPVLLWLVRDWYRNWRFIGYSAVGFLVVFISVWHIHFSLGDRVMSSLPDQGFYQASDEYKSILSAGANDSLSHFPVMLRDSLRFLPHYERGVPQLDLCKADENGSPFFFWPLGARSINYRWETPQNVDAYRYLYMQANPAVWWISATAVVLSTGLILSWLFFSPGRQLKQPAMLLTFYSMYVAYMIVMARIDRVMYLYHYLIPLIFSFILFALVLMEMQTFAQWKKINGYARSLILLTCAILIFAGYQFYRPLTYYELITDDAFKKRMIFDYWDLHCVNCERENPMIQQSC